MPRYRKKPLAQLEHGTRIYSPSAGETRFRVVTTDPTTGERIYLKFPDEELARAKARELEQFIAQSAPIRDSPELGPRTVGRLATSYLEDHCSGLSLRYREKQEYLLRKWVLPRLADKPVTAWTPADSATVLNDVRAAGRSDSLVQNVGAAMRGLVTHARRLRWLTSLSEDPLWRVRYSATASVQGASAVYVPRSSLPTDAECAALFEAMEGLGETRWATAMRLAHRSGLRWGELTALQPRDIDFEPHRVVRVERAVEQGSSGPAGTKKPKNGRVRTTIFPRSLADELRDLVDRTRREHGNSGLLFPGPRGGFARRATFQRIWIRSADAAGWPMDVPLRRSAGYGQTNKGWRWTGQAKWSPHDLRHVAACWMLYDVKLDPAVVADKLGHADPSFTVKRYIGIRGNADATATAMTEEL